MHVKHEFISFLEDNTNKRYNPIFEKRYGEEKKINVIPMKTESNTYTILDWLIQRKLAY